MGIKQNTSIILSALLVIFVLETNAKSDLQIPSRQEIQEALDMSNSQKLPQNVLRYLHCVFLDLDYQASNIGTGDEDAALSGQVYEVLLKKQYNSQFSQFMAWWKASKSRESILDLCPGLVDKLNLVDNIRVETEKENAEYECARKVKRGELPKETKCSDKQALPDDGIDLSPVGPKI